MERTNDKNVAQLCNNIELYIGRKLRTPKDFEFLSETIMTRTRLYVSATTLKRMWGYLHETTRARTSTLDVLSKFLGYQDWVDFCNTYAEFNPNSQEGTIEAERINCTELNPGQLIDIKWLPNSSCRLEYMGEYEFKVVSSINSKLRPGDLINCFFIIENEVLYLTDSIVEGKLHDMYYLGKTGGVTFQIIE